MEDSFLTPIQAANILNISLSTLKKLIYQEKIKTFKTPGGHHRILKSDIMRSHKNSESNSAAHAMAAGPRESVLRYVSAFTSIIERRNRYCRGHASRVSAISVEIAGGLGFSRGQIERVADAALLHDIGMLFIPESIINKERPFEDNDYEIVKSHPQMGADMLDGFEIFGAIVPVIRQHHEKPDGSGYPCGLKGSQICPEAKIIAVAESFDCLISLDSYRRPLKVRDALKLVKDGAGTQYDPDVVGVFLEKAGRIIK
jgi:excisionase family DNA binding protein